MNQTCPICKREMDFDSDRIFYCGYCNKPKQPEETCSCQKPKWKHESGPPDERGILPLPDGARWLYASREYPNCGSCMSGDRHFFGGNCSNKNCFFGPCHRVGFRIKEEEKQ